MREAFSWSENVLVSVNSLWNSKEVHKIQCYFWRNDDWNESLMGTLCPIYCHKILIKRSRSIESNNLVAIRCLIAFMVETLISIRPKKKMELAEIDTYIGTSVSSDFPAIYFISRLFNFIREMFPFFSCCCSRMPMKTKRKIDEFLWCNAVSWDFKRSRS